MSTQVAFDFSAKPQTPDVCRRKHGGNAESEAANERVKPHKRAWRELIWEQVNACGYFGCTLNELKIWDANWIDPKDGVKKGRFKTPNELSGRCSELTDPERRFLAPDEKSLFKSGRRRNGCAVYVSDQKWMNGSHV